MDSSSLLAAVTQLKREVAALQRQVRQLTGMIRPSTPSGPPADSRKDFVRLEKRDFRDVVMTVGEAAGALGLGEEQVRRLLRAEKLAGVPLGGRAGWQVSRESVMEMIAARQNFSRPRTVAVARGRTRAASRPRTVAVRAR
jgi:excisionase family DNA binding protein